MIGMSIHEYKKTHPDASGCLCDNCTKDCYDKSYRKHCIHFEDAYPPYDSDELFSDRYYEGNDGMSQAWDYVDKLIRGMSFDDIYGEYE